MTDEEMNEIEKINQMSRMEMARLWRFAPSGHVYFDIMKPFYSVFEKRFFGKLGGFTPELSKALSWEP